MRVRIGSVLILLLELTACLPKDTPLKPDRGPTAHQRSWPVMGTILSIQGWAANSSELSRAMEEAYEATADVDRKMSVYRPESEISEINRRAGETQPIKVSSETLGVIEAALRRGKDTEGAFDITIGPLMDLWTLHAPWRGEDRLPPPEKAIASTRKLLGLHHVLVNPAERTVRLTQKGMRLDLGGIAKGYSLDRAAALLLNQGVQRALLDLGGQILVLGAPPSGDHWQFGIRDPKHPSENLGIISIDRGSLATSGNYERFFMHKGKRYAHILDPRTGWPATGVHAVTVWAPDGITADGWSAALFVAGPLQGKRLLDSHPELGAVWITDEGVEAYGALAGRITRSENSNSKTE